MSQPLVALLVSGPSGTCLPLTRVLEEEGFEARLLQSCAQAREVLKEPTLPAVIFSEELLPDGSWADVLRAANLTQHPVPVIVVSRTVNIDLYISALEKGAADFIVPPFYRQDISHVLDCAARKSTGSFDRPGWMLLAV